MRNGRWVQALSAAALVGVVGCDAIESRCVSVGGCFDPDFLPDLDAAIDAATIDAETASLDGGVDAGGQLDVPFTPDAGPGLSISQFCDAQFATARAFSDGACHCLGADIEGLNYVREVVLRYPGSTACIEAVEAIVAKTSYDPQQAAACAARFDAQFELPAGVSSCAASGFDVGELAASVGKGAQTLVQLPECRATFVGSKLRDARCTTSLECSSGLRCLPLPGTPLGAGGAVPSSCQPARPLNEACATSSDCSDGLICSGVTETTQTCIAVSALKSEGGRCRASYECRLGLACNGQGVCQPPMPDVVCKQ